MVLSHGISFDYSFLHFFILLFFSCLFPSAPLSFIASILCLFSRSFYRFNPLQFTFTRFLSFLLSADVLFRSLSYPLILSPLCFPLSYILLCIHFSFIQYFLEMKREVERMHVRLRGPLDQRRDKKLDRDRLTDPMAKQGKKHGRQTTHSSTAFDASRRDPRLLDPLASLFKENP